jgi:hypothetical protein
LKWCTLKKIPSPTKPTPEKALDFLDLGDVGVLGGLIATPVAVLLKQIEVPTTNEVLNLCTLS